MTTMTSRADVEEIQATRTEKLLAFVLAAFILLGGVWTYQKLDDVVRAHEPLPTQTLGPASHRLAVADRGLQLAVQGERAALRRLVFTREAYRTALEAHRPAAALGAKYDAAQARYEQAKASVTEARRTVDRLRPAGLAENRRVHAKVSAAIDKQERDVFFVRLALVAFGIVSSYLLLARMRKGASRWFPLAGSFVGAATILAFVLASDYLTDYFNPFDWGIAFIALLGIVCTLLVYWVLQRYLLRRLPSRRVRRHQCPFCGYPAGAGTHCEDCGREIVAPCTKCEEPRRVGTAHCAVCGR
jgi:hypothetical protein